jgi:HD-GYP domain-containing protein (c-di-GMP phosphodiesterase class II)
MNPVEQGTVEATTRADSLTPDLERQLQQAREELRELNKIGMALMSERDPDALLGTILTQARRLTTSDGGSLYLVEESEERGTHLHFLRAQTDSLPDMPDPDFTLPLDRTSVAGYAALTGEPLVIDDAYEIPEGAPYSFNRGFDKEHGYRAKSMLVVPMKDHRGKTVGVLQLINRKRTTDAIIRCDSDADEHVLPYGEREVEIVQSLAGQAAVSIENGRLYRAIENLFEGFIKAAVGAIDQRDPATSGHSVRVTAMTTALAEVVHKEKERERFKDVRYTKEEMKQLRYAGLLHDFGKVGVREEVLVKVMKLPPVIDARVRARFELVRRSLDSEFHRRRAEYLHENGRGEAYAKFLTGLEAEIRERRDRLDEYHQAVMEANTPRVLPGETAEILQEINRQTFIDPSGEEHPFITDEELHYLSIPKGNLDENERKQIESHVDHSYSFLMEIPWTDDLSRVAEIVWGHHEKLNGRGYPRGVSADDIPLETRMMTVADIFDALTASDRPYKKAMPVERALSILQMEADEGGLDPDLVEMFMESKVYEEVLNKDWREL